MKKLYIDGSNLIHRCHWVSKNSKVSSVYIFLTSIKKYANLFQTTDMYIAWDARRDRDSVNHRREILGEEYKGNRDKEKRKLGINGEELRPKYAILDPELTLSCPIAPTISAGVDAIVHAHDCYISKGHTTMSRVFSLEGFRRVYNNLPKVLQDPEDINFRTEPGFNLCPN